MSIPTIFSKLPPLSLILTSILLRKAPSLLFTNRMKSWQKRTSRSYPMTLHQTPLIWIDLEMTGLNVDTDHILEIATIVTNSNLDIIAEGPVFAIHQPDEILAKMDEWNTTQHNHSGLIERVRRSAISEKSAENKTLLFLEQYVPKGVSPMCGNSICQDRRFLHRCMPTLAHYFHYRNLDVTSIKILAQRWAPDIAAQLTKASHHLALDDIRDSIAELRFYREHFFRT